MTPLRERKQENVHYSNGREAKNGDKVVLFGYGGPMIGILYDASAGNDFCNGKIALTKSNNPYPNLWAGVVADTRLDIFKRVALVPDGSKKETA